MAKESQDPFDRHARSGGTVAVSQEEFTVQSQSAAIKFLREGVQPPSRVYIGVDDVLQVSFANNNGLGQMAIRGRILRPDGIIVPFDEFFTVGATRSFNFFNFSLSEGFLLSMTASIPLPGTAEVSTYVQVSVKRGGSAVLFGYDVLMAGYVGQNRLLAWPSYPATRPLEGPGMIRVIAGSTPVAGAEINEVVPTNARWRLISAFFQLTAANAGGTRTVRVTVDDGLNKYYQVSANGGVAVNTVATLALCNQGAPSSQISTDLYIAHDSNLLMLPAHRWRTLTNNLNAADQYTNPIYIVQEWFEDQ